MRRQWWILTAGLTALTLLATWRDLFWRADLAIYDAGLLQRPAPADIVIVAIDDASLVEFGRWPWPRARHAQLLERLREAGAAAVALDLIVTEPDSADPENDDRLAQAMRLGPPTVLPLIVDMPLDSAPIERLPITILAGAAAGLGHVQLEVDRDGIARSLYLREGLGTANRPQLMLALLQSLGAPPGLPLSSERNPDPVGSPDVWVRDYRVQIPFLGPPGHFTQYSYRDVLGGRVPDRLLRGKLVLVGMTAQGGGDAYPTPLSGYSRAMPGVEINANVLQGLRQGTMTRRAPRTLSLIFSVVPLWLGCFGLWRLTPRRSLVCIVVLWGVTLCASVASLRILHWQWPSAATLVALALAYPIWSWLRLESTQQYLESELELLAAERIPLLGSFSEGRRPRRVNDAIQSRIELLRRATARVRDLRRLLADTVKGLPDATLVMDPEGEVVLANGAAALLFGAPDETSIEGEAWERFRGVFGADTAGRDTPEVFEIRQGTPEKDLLVRAVPLLSNAPIADRIGTLVSIVDISDLRAAQREREDVIRFLSHDLKSPASSLLGLAQLQRDPRRALQPPELANRLDALAHRTLDLLDGFIAIAQAESVDPMVFSELDLRDVLQDACDEVWAYSESRGIQIDARHPAAPLIVLGDRRLLARAVVNLLNNAVKFSPQNSRVLLDCNERASLARVSIIDQGAGVPEEMAQHLFKRFSRAPAAGKAHPAGTGLGLAFVRIVAEKHGGSIRIVPNADGARFDLQLPAAKAQIQAL